MLCIFYSTLSKCLRFHFGRFSSSTGACIGKPTYHNRKNREKRIFIRLSRFSRFACYFTDIWTDDSAPQQGMKSGTRPLRSGQAWAVRLRKIAHGLQLFGAHPARHNALLRTPQPLFPGFRETARGKRRHCTVTDRRGQLPHRLTPAVPGRKHARQAGTAVLIREDIPAFVEC